jgi:hemoglobin-like flavoprotein
MIRWRSACSKGGISIHSPPALQASGGLAAAWLRHASARPVAQFDVVTIELPCRPRATTGPMTPEQLESVRRTAAVVEHALDQCVTCFYDDLFDRSPQVRPLFADDLIARRGTLLHELLALAGAAHDLPGFLVQARELGRRHQRQGIHAADYAFVGEALIAAIGAVNGDGWTTGAEESWRRMYALIADAMLEGAEAGLFNQADGVEAL